MCMQCAETDLVNGIDHSSGLGGRRWSGISVLDLEQQGLSADGLKVVVSLIFRPAGIPTFQPSGNLIGGNYHSGNNYGGISTILHTTMVFVRPGPIDRLPLSALKFFSPFLFSTYFIL